MRADIFVDCIALDLQSIGGRIKPYDANQSIDSFRLLFEIVQTQKKEPKIKSNEWHIMGQTMNLLSASVTRHMYRLKSSDPDITYSSLSPANEQLFIVHELK